MKELIQRLKNEDGVTLVEMIAAIAILSIVVTAFLAFFVQAGRTNNMTTEMNEATFLAQEEMEIITSYSLGNYGVEYVKENHFNNKNSIRKPAGNGLIIETTLKNPSTGSSLYGVVVKVREGEKLRAQMETKLPFEKETRSENTEK